MSRPFSAAFTLSAAALGVLVSAYPSARADVAEVQRVTPTPRLTSQIFGQGLAFDGENIVVGAAFESAPSFGAGAAYVFRPNGSGVWMQQQRLAAPSPASTDWFGLHLAMSGDTLLVSAAGRMVGGLDDAGAVFIYGWSGASWVYQTTLGSPTPIQGGYFGDPVAIEGDVIAIGAFTSAFPSAGGFAGREVFVFERTAGIWTQTGRLPAPAAYSNGFHGQAGLAISGGVIFAGGSQQPTSTGDPVGAVYVMEKIGGAWQQTAELRPSDRPTNPYFGQSVAADGGRVVVGAPVDEINGQPIAGSIYEYTRGPIGWSEVRKLTAQNPATRDFFGVHVALQGSTLLVGAYESEFPPFTRNGHAFLYHYANGGLSTPTTLTASDGQPHDIFGWRVALAGDRAAITAPFQTLNQGAAYIFEGVSPPCREDLDGDGVVGLADLSALLSSFGSSQPGLAGDIDQDGDVDLQDLARLLAAFGTSCN